MPAITYCPPAPAHITLEPLPAFNHGKKVTQDLEAIYCRLEDGTLGYGSKGLDGSDFYGNSAADRPGMQVAIHKPSGQRRLDTPAWALRNDMLADVIANYCLSRAGVRHRVGTVAEKMALAKTLAARRRKMLVGRLDCLCSRYVAAKKQTRRDYAELRSLEINIENLDTSLRILDNEAVIAAGVVYHYYHRHADSVAVGQALGLKSPHVRIMLWRLRIIAAELGYDKHAVADERKSRPQRAPTKILPCDVPVVLQMHKDGKRISEISEAFFGVRYGSSYHCIRRVLRVNGLLQGNKKGAANIAAPVLLSSPVAHDAGHRPFAKFHPAKLLQFSK
jgi:hypothetical protein